MGSRHTRREWFTIDCSTTGTGEAKFISELRYVSDIQLVAYELDLGAAPNNRERLLGLRLEANGNNFILGRTMQADAANVAEYSCVFPIRRHEDGDLPVARQFEHPINIALPQIVTDIRRLKAELVEYDNLPTNATNLVANTTAKLLFEVTLDTTL